MLTLRIIDENGDRTEIPLMCNTSGFDDRQSPEITEEWEGTPILEGLHGEYTFEISDITQDIAHTLLVIAEALCQETDEAIPDDTTLSWDEWNAKIDTILAEYRSPQIFSAITAYGKVYGIPHADIQEALRSISRMLCADRVSAKEFRGIVGARLPGASGIAARALGVTPGVLARMIEERTIDAEDFFQKFARQLEIDCIGSTRNT